MLLDKVLFTTLKLSVYGVHILNKLMFVISNLQGQIDKLATADQLSQKVSELQALISSNQTGISSLETKLAEV